MLEVKNLTTHYGIIRALNRVSFSIPQTGIFPFVGANGAGKSTLMRTIMGLVTPTSGEVFFFQQNITELTPPSRVYKGISLCPEGRRIFKSVTVEENLLAGAYLCKDKSIIAGRVGNVYEFFPKLKERRKQRAGTLSGGEQQMLAIGRALMSAPKLLLLDEPSMGLAPNLVEMVFEKVKEIQESQNISVILVEQNAEMALAISNYAYVLEVGTLVLEGTGISLISSDEVRKKYLGV